MIVTTEHLRSIPGFSVRRGFCLSQTRVWFLRHGLDFRDFVRNGIDAEQLEATGDGMAIALIQHARKVEEQRDGQ